MESYDIINATIKTNGNATKKDYLNKGDCLKIVFENNLSTRGCVISIDPERIFQSSKGKITFKLDRDVTIDNGQKISIYGKNRKHIYVIIADGKLVIEKSNTKSKSNNNKIHNILFGIGIAIGVAALLICTVFVVGYGIAVLSHDGIWPPFTIPMPFSKKRYYFKNGKLHLVELFENTPAKNTIAEISKRFGITYKIRYVKTKSGIIKYTYAPYFSKKYPINFTIPKKLRTGNVAAHYCYANACLDLMANSNKLNRLSEQSYKALYKDLRIDTEAINIMKQYENPKYNQLSKYITKDLYKLLYPTKHQQGKNLKSIKKLLNESSSQYREITTLQYKSPNGGPEVNMGKEHFNFTWHHEYTFGQNGRLRYVNREIHDGVKHIGGEAILKELDLN
jgi:hypothetical protein